MATGLHYPFVQTRLHAGTKDINSNCFFLIIFAWAPLRATFAATCNNKRNGQFPSSVVPLFQNESKHETVHMVQFHFHANQSHFNENGFVFQTKTELFCSVFKKICVHTYRFRIVFARPHYNAVSVLKTFLYPQCARSSELDACAFQYIDPRNWHEMKPHGSVCPQFWILRDRSPSPGASISHTNLMRQLLRVSFYF